MNTSINEIYALGISHNPFPLPLPDGTYFPDYLSQGDPRALEFLTQFDRVRSKPWDACSILDLGCSEGSTTLGLSQTDAHVYGVEGRADGVHRARVLRDILGFDKTDFAVGNVDHESSFREVDAIFNAGILYHLEDPVRFLERCAKNAREFMYVDTGHAPRSQQERENSKFSVQFGDTYTIERHGLTLDVVDFAEPHVREERQNGLRRGPRAGIGNTNSVWLAHHSLIALMEKLGFPHHDTIKDVPVIPRLRTCFFRERPRDVVDLGPLARPLPRREPQARSVPNANARDIAYLVDRKRPVTVVGHEPLVAKVCDDLETHGIAIGERIVVPGAVGDMIPTRAMQRILDGRDGLLVIATDDLRQNIDRIMLLDRFEYVFSSFAQMHLLKQL